MKAREHFRKAHYSILMIQRNFHRYYSVCTIVTVVLTLLACFVFLSDILTYNNYRDVLNLPSNMAVYTYQTFENETPAPMPRQQYVLDKIEEQSISESTFISSSGNSNYYYLEDGSPATFSVKFISADYFDYPKILFGYDIVNQSILSSPESTTQQLLEGNGAIISTSTSLSMFGTTNSLGQEFEIEFMTSGEKIQQAAQQFIVVGITNSTISVEEGLEVLVGMHHADSLLPLESTTVRTYFLDETAELQFLSEDFQASNITFSARLINSFKTQRYNDNILIFSILFIIAITSQLTIFSSFSSIFQYRLNEIGILQALGAKKKDIFIIQLIEVFIIISLCTFISLSLATTISLSYISYMRISKDIFYGLYLDSSRIRLLLVFIFLLTLSSSLIISYRSTKYRIIDTIRQNS